MFLQDFNKEQLKMLAQIIANIGHAFFIASFIPFLIGLEPPDVSVVISLLLISIGCWVIAVLLLVVEDKK